ncbi:TetR/AcrR family transcriptional regulator [Nesterenkonia alkaliphila]|uniref:TetR family transcriptional regulator n=1 Tax=Nesterenkonia alkaliphila TaxID=1463631 RepID=A0A7K1UIL2_9MICC|nr:TetR/AcrR family transcriptional regulator [Nesterenkonia alkaliphila]MVT26299.1 TetR family transcriptional regulator [Nesterenkonia alkaliphila]GFZ99203.1 TetR family transcriptional regulator [Nesterenkonia alkaliphila]
MTASPRERRYRLREQQIIEQARQIAESEGWASVTTRRLAQEINHSQPVIYQHFDSRDRILAAVVTQGFRELTALIRGAASASGDALEQLCWSYLDFGRQNPALYEAMFTKPTHLRFAHEDTPEELRASFEALTGIIRQETATTSNNDAAALTELFWATCHGLTSLHLAGRIPETHLAAHVQRTCTMIRS